jgi:redox-sensitive bicupin YhaK (pirin superfamily)
MVEPHFSMLWSDEIPRRTARDAEGRTTEVTVVAGAYGDLKPPSPPPKSYASQPDSEVAIWTLKMQAGAKHTLPAASSGTERTLYVFDGTGVKIAGRTVRAGYQAHLRADVETALVAGSGETEVGDITLEWGERDTFVVPVDLSAEEAERMAREQEPEPSGT